MGALRELFPKHGTVRQHHGRHVLFEYVMLQGINDSLEDARRLLDLTHGIECKFNLIGFNPHPGTRFRPSPLQQVCQCVSKSIMNSGGALPSPFQCVCIRAHQRVVMSCCCVCAELNKKVWNLWILHVLC